MKKFTTLLLFALTMLFVNTVAPAKDVGGYSITNVRQQHDQNFYNAISPEKEFVIIQYQFSITYAELPKLTINPENGFGFVANTVVITRFVSYPIIRPRPILVSSFIEKSTTSDKESTTAKYLYGNSRIGMYGV